MAKAETKVPVTTESKPESPLTATQMQTWRPVENLRREVDRLFEDFTLNPFRLPFPIFVPSRRRSPNDSLT